MRQYSVKLLHMQCYCMEQNTGDTGIAHCRYCRVMMILSNPISVFDHCNMLVILSLKCTVEAVFKDIHIENFRYYVRTYIPLHTHTDLGDTPINTQDSIQMATHIRN